MFNKRVFFYRLKALLAYWGLFFNFWLYFWNIYTRSVTIYLYSSTQNSTFHRFQDSVSCVQPRKYNKTKTEDSEVAFFSAASIRETSTSSMYYHSLSIYTIEAGPNDNTTHIFSIHSSSSSSVSIYSCVKPLQYIQYITVTHTYIQSNGPIHL